MVGRRMGILAFLGAMALGATVRADLMPIAPLDAGDQQPPWACAPTDLPHAASPDLMAAGFADFVGTADRDSCSIAFLPYSSAPARLPSETKPAHVLADHQDSLTLCLYALCGLGLYWSGPLVKKFHFGGVPDWYHYDGPSQIGHSLAISPNCLPSALLVCFRQPSCEAKEVAPQYVNGAITAALKESQFPPTALASRGPPTAC